MKNAGYQKKQKRQKRAKRVRAKIFGTTKRPRLSVFRSNKHIYLQLISDEKGKTLVSASDLEIKKNNKAAKSETAGQVGELLAKKATELKISQVIFDKGGYQYHGQVKAAAEGARRGGLKF
ncbi:MAG: 50S ribosomal protein L18 [Candidatus Portnoybacteria bacterium]|jgi:large subunit ribosomal protein L18|nr:50S ribosomal protein L18 [Candidatus Portnoybacteria bacterium]